ncbi:MAG: S-ribosylhomocysteine lyase, partial [Clostridia bacterium]|nr:S-ribosylhomocysteine lyase [Clostridia bacterium]
FEKSVIYVGPMGCRTGFYLLLRDDVSYENAIKLTYEAFKFTAEFEGTIPGSSKIECGNYLEHDLEGAKAVAIDMMTVLENYTPEMMIYEV